MEIFRRSGFDKPLFITMLLMIAFGLIMVFSSSAILADEKYQEPFHFLIQQLIGVGIGLILITLIITRKNAFYQSQTFVYGLLALSLILLAVCLFMPAIGRTNRWIIFFGLRFQPSELAKFSLILYFAHYLNKKKDKINNFQTFFPPFAVLLLSIILIIKEPDYGTALLIFFTCALMFFIGGLRLHYFFYLGVFSLGFFIFFLLKAPYRLSRVLAFISPASDPQGAGFHAIQSKLAIGSGGLLGVSIGESTQKLFFLPCAHTDYIYAIVGEELGLLGTLTVLLLFGIVLWRGVVISRKAPNLFCKLLAAGITFAICTQALVNISIVVGLGPATGLPLPLFSYGRSSFICTLLCMGVLLHISQRKSGQRKK